MTVKITDPAGNSCTATQVITVMSAGCNVMLTAPTGNPAYLNKSNDSQPSSPTTLEYTVTGAATNCPNTAALLFIGGSQTNMVTTDAAGAFSFPISLPEGPAHIEVHMDNGVQPTVAAVDVVVDRDSSGGVQLHARGSEPLHRGAR